jgi:ribonuclease P protein component
VGVIVSKKVGGAVVRNKVKRKLREIFRKRLENSFQLPRDIVVIARFSANKATLQQLDDSVRYGLNQILKNDKNKKIN